MVNLQLYQPFYNIIQYSSAYYRKQDCLILDGKYETGEKLDSTQHVICSYGGIPMYEIDINSTITSVSNFNVDYPMGVIYVSQSMENQIVTIIWYATAKIRYKASSVSIDDTGNLYTSDNVEDALQEISKTVTTNVTTINSSIVTTNNNVNNIISYNGSGTKDPELINGRTDSLGVIHTTLKQSMDANYAVFLTQQMFPSLYPITLNNITVGNFCLTNIPVILGTTITLA